MSKHLDLARKLNELAKRGEGGEQTNAADRLNALMEKHGFTLEDIEGDKTDFHYFKKPGDPVGHRLFCQVAVSVLGSGSYYTDPERPDYFVIEVTAAAAVEVEARFDFYYAAFLRESDIFLSAFIQKNDLYAPEAKTIGSDDLTWDDLKRQMKIERLKDGIDRYTYFNQLKQ